MKNEQYVRTSLEVILFQTEDIIVTSGPDEYEDERVH